MQWNSLKHKQMLELLGGLSFWLHLVYTQTSSVTCTHYKKFSVCYTGHSWGLRSPVLTDLQCLILSPALHQKQWELETSMSGCLHWDRKLCTSMKDLLISSFLNPCSWIASIFLSRQNARGCFAPPRDHGEEAACTLSGTEYKSFPWMKWLHPNPSIWQRCPKCSKVITLLLPKTLQSWVFQWRQGEPDRTSVEERQMTARPQNLIWAACKFEGELWLYFTSLVFIPLLLHAPHRMREAVCGKETWHRKGGGRVLGAPGFMEPLELGCSAPQEHVKAAVESPAPLWKLLCHSNRCYGYGTGIASPDSLDCAALEIKLDGPSRPGNLVTIKSHFPFSLNVRNTYLQSQATFFFFSSSREPVFLLRKFRGRFFSLRFITSCYSLLESWEKTVAVLKAALTHYSIAIIGALQVQLPDFWAAIFTYKPENSQSVSAVSSFLNFGVRCEWGFEPKQCYCWDHSEMIFETETSQSITETEHHRPFLILEIRSSSKNAWEPVLWA